MLISRWDFRTAPQSETVGNKHAAVHIHKRNVFWNLIAETYRQTIYKVDSLNA